MKKILITGGTGFIGSNMINFLLLKKNYFVFNLDKKIQKKNIFNSSHKNILQFKGNILNNNILSNIFKKYKFNYIINFAAETHVDKSIHNSKKFYNSNVLGVLNILENIKKTKINTKFIHISTDEVFGSLKKNEKSFDENSNFDPNNPYAASKAASDLLVKAYSKTHNINSIVTNCSNNFGEHQHPEKLIPLVILRCLSGSSIPVYGNGKNIREWIYVKDHCEAIFKVITNGKKHSRYLIGSGIEITNIQLIKKICKILDFKIPQTNQYKNLIEFIKDRPSHDFRYSINSKKIKSELNFKLSYSFDQALENTIDHYIENKNYYLNIYTKSKWFKKHYG